MRFKMTALLWLAVSAVGAQAQTFTEPGDAGQTLATAQPVPAGTTQIIGSIQIAQDVDLYEITFSSAGTVVFDGTFPSSDANLILFDAMGHGLWGDDDAGTGLDAQITWTVSPGTYYLGFAGNNLYAFNAAGIMFCGNDSGDCSANTTDVLDYFVTTSSSKGSYTITLTGTLTQAITFTSVAPTNAVVGDPPYVVTATGGGSGNPVIFSIDPAASAVCSMSGNSVSLTAVGTCTINANQAGGGGYAAAPQVQQSFAVGRATQTITFTSTPPVGAVVGDTYIVTADGGGSNNPVVFSVDASATSVCAIVGSTVTLTGAGDCVINADQDGNDTYDPAPQVQQRFPVSVAGVSVTIIPPSLPPAQVGTAYSLSLSATGGTGPYVFVVTGGVLPAGLSLSTVGLLSGTPTDSGVAHFTVTAADSSVPVNLGVQAYDLTVTGAPLLTPSAVPILSEWSLIAMSALIGLLGMSWVRRRD